MVYNSKFIIKDIEIKNMSVGFITNALIFIQRTNINKEYENELRKELRKKTLKIYE